MVADHPNVPAPKHPPEHAKILTDCETLGYIAGCGDGSYPPELGFDEAWPDDLTAAWKHGYARARKKQGEDDVAKTEFKGFDPHADIAQKNSELRDKFALSVAPTIVRVMAPHNRHDDWPKASVVGATVYAVADAIMAARARKPS